MLHGGIAAQRDIDDVAGGGADRTAQIVRKRIDSRDGGEPQLFRAAGGACRVVDAADEIGAPSHLWILDGETREPDAAVEIDQECGDVRRAKIDRQSECARLRTGTANDFRAPDEHRDRAARRAQLRSQ